MPQLCGIQYNYYPMIIVMYKKLYSYIKIQIANLLILALQKYIATVESIAIYIT